ncbi:EAL and HDOD domain-containing protein [Exiguobacterium aurantiacum]|uniref:Predicted signal transduction protein containing sensor and EAL domains n=1 Tax=Exiguobacterium aurantiacum TaxID=33987 RepID=A0A377FRQ4_9BACL|nr:HDOD domain-containing protein [Exiguobacterium aurantiacum]STO07145.1 Predicted signal transduction protein containing sensor and EAL domains [Exiguobacterium aurantiacum]
MKVYVARQPIFDQKLRVCGYELLYRRSEKNIFEHVDDALATADVIHNAYLVFNFRELTEGTRAFINFPQNLIEGEVPALLPRQSLVVEVLEHVEPTEKVLAALRSLRRKGYTIALDDFVFEEKYRPLIGLADIIKIDYQATPVDQQKRLIDALGHRVEFLAEKIETPLEYETAKKLGYKMFQGYFFSRPTVVHGAEVHPLRHTLVEVLKELDRPEPNFRRIAGQIERSVDLSYKMLRSVNTVYQKGRHTIQSIEQAVARIGLDEMRRWSYLMLLREMQTSESKELIKQSVIRGKMMELIADDTVPAVTPFDAFITGIFSSLDVILDETMTSLVAELPVEPVVKEALLGKRNKLRELLDAVTAYERLTVPVDESAPDWSPYYIRAIQWAQTFDEKSE